MTYNTGKRFRNLEGQKFGRLLALYKVNKSGRSVWHCICDCGNEVDIPSKHLLSNNTRSCGCLSREISSKVHGKPLKEVELNRIYIRYKIRAKHKEIDFFLTKEDIKNIINTSCTYCGKFPQPYNGIDRIDSSKGYILENCVPCCSWCNTMKLNYTKEEFLNKCLKIVRHNGL